jgi:hypothetical protein
VAPPVGPAGIRSCTGEADAASTTRRIALDGAFSATTLHFSGGATFDADERRESLAASYEQRLSDRWTFTGTLGASVGGSLRVGTAGFDLTPGPLAGASIACRVLDDHKLRPFVLVSLSLAASWGETSLRGTPGAPSIVSTDGRIGVAAGKTIARILTPYVAARVFGGPVFWKYGGESVTGTDTHHYQVGAGFSLALRRFDVHLEMAPLGERELAAGAGIAF